MPRDTSGKPVLVDMARSKEDKKRENMPIARESGPDYPYGLRFDLDHAGLKKMGMKDLPEIGKEIHMHVKAHVASASSEKREGGEENKRVGLQITHLGMLDQEEKKPEEKADRKRH